MIAFLSLGSNIGDKQNNIEAAIKQIESRVGTLIVVSKMYKSSAWGFESDNYFLNNAVKIETELNPQELLTEINKIEKELGRKRTTKGYSDRIIDIDILFYENEIIDEANLKIPHPLLQERKFVLYPLNDIAANITHPILNKTVGELIQFCDDKSYCELIT